MSYKYKNPSIVGVFTALQVVLLLFIISWLVYRFCDLRDAAMRTELRRMSWDIETDFSYYLSHAESMVQVIGSEIALKDSGYEHVKDLISRLGKKSRLQNVVQWQNILWISNDGTISFNQKRDNGPKLRQRLPIQLAEQCKKDPGTLYTGFIEKHDKDEMEGIPFCFGVQDNNDKYMGYFIGEFMHEAFNKKVFHYWNHDKSYIIADEHGAIVMRSKGYEKSIDIIDSYIKSGNYNSIMKTSLFPSIVPSHDKSYFVRKMKELPFFIIVIKQGHLHIGFGQSSNFIGLFIDSIIIISLFGVISFFMRQKLVKPVTDLSKIATNISEGKHNVVFPRYNYQRARTSF